MQETATLEDALRAYAERWPDKPCLIIDEVEFDAKQIDARVASAATGLKSAGVGPGDVVAIFAHNSPEWVFVWLAAPRAGAIVAFCNTALKGEFLAFQLRDCRAKLVFTSPDLVERVTAVAADLPTLATIVVEGSDVGLQPASPFTLLPSSVLSASEPAGPPVDDGLGWSDPAFIIYTSGTTGPSKGAVASQRYLLNVGESNRLASEYGPDDVIFGALPLFHLSGLALVLTALVSGATGVIDKSFHVSTCWQRIRDVGATGFSAVGPMMVMLWNQPPRDDDATVPVRVSMCAPIPPDLHEGLEARFGLRFTSSYGLSEAVPPVYQPLSVPSRPGSAGVRNPQFDVRIFDETDHEVATGVVGEIVCRSLEPHIMFEGYFENPAATVAQLRNLWFHTGDLGRFDEDGYFYLVDRKKDAMRRRGENVSSFEVEQAILAHPAVLECAAFAVPSPLGEDDVMVALVMRRGMSCSYEEIMDHCVARMPYFALPSYLEVLDELPKNAVSRVQKFKLRDRGVQDSTWNREAAGYVVARR